MTETLRLSTALLCAAIAAVAAIFLPATAADLPPVPSTAAPAAAPASGAARPALPSRHAPPEAEELTVALGEVRLLPMAGKVTRVALGSGAVLSATTVDTNLLLIAEKVGDTTLMVWTGRNVHAYKVQVVSHDLAATRRKVEALLGNTRGITLTRIGNDLVLSGIAHRETLARLGKTLGDLPNVINNMTEDPGSAYTRSVLFRLTFVEVKKSLLEDIGISWSKDAPGPVAGLTGVAHNNGLYDNLPGPQGSFNPADPNPAFITRNGRSGGVFLGLATTIASRLNFGINNGDARVLASPELTARSGGKANLQVGGEVPIPLSGAFGSTTVEFKPYGILFAVEPQIDADDTITAKLSTELSQIDPGVSVQGIPGFVTRNTSTEISVKPGEVVALSGLINSELSTSIDRVPGLSRIPLFGRLFRSDDFRNNKSELVVLVETEIIAPGQGLAGQLRARGLEAGRAFQEKVDAARQPPFPRDAAAAGRKGD
jgi:pilus assembly protein CpaC